VPADGVDAATCGNGDFGMSPCGQTQMSGARDSALIAQQSEDVTKLPEMLSIRQDVQNGHFRGEPHTLFLGNFGTRHANLVIKAC
jgi:hypothetical protein